MLVSFFKLIVGPIVGPSFWVLQITMKKQVDVGCAIRLESLKPIGVWGVQRSQHVCDVLRTRSIHYQQHGSRIEMIGCAFHLQIGK